MKTVEEIARMAYEYNHDRGYMCSESVVHAMNDGLGLGLPAELLAASSSFGGCPLTCTHSPHIFSSCLSPLPVQLANDRQAHSSNGNSLFIRSMFLNFKLLIIGDFSCFRQAV